MLNARFTPLDAIENAAGNFRRPLGNQEGKVAAQRFGRRVPEHALGGGIPIRDHTVQLLRDNGVIGRIHDGRKPKRFLLRFFSGADIAKHEHHADQRSLGSANRGSAIVNRHLSAVAGDERCVIGQSHDGPFAEHP